MVRMKSFGGCVLVLVERFLFFMLMMFIIKIFLLFKVFVEIIDGERRFIEFLMDFKRVNYFFVLVLKFVVKIFFGIVNFRKRRLIGIGLFNDEVYMDIGE